MENFYSNSTLRGYHRCWRWSMLLAVAMLTAMILPYTSMGQANKDPITGNILGGVPVKGPFNGTSIDGDAYAYHRDLTYKVPDLSTPALDDSITLNFNNFGDIFYWGEVYAPNGDEEYPNDIRAGVLDVVHFGAGNTPADFTAVIHDFPEVEDDTTIVYADGIGNQDLTGFSSSTKMNDDPELEWTWGPTSSPQKDDMQNCGAIFTWGDPNLIGIDGEPGDPNDLWCAFAADRKSVHGVSWISFEFLQSTMEMTVTGTNSKGQEEGGFVTDGPDGGRTVGDIIVFVGLFNGGDQADVKVNRWTDMGGGVFQYVEILSSKDDPVHGYPYGSILATVNTEVTPVHFPAFGQYDDFFINGEWYTLPYYEINQWCEGAINVSALFDLDEDPCLTVSTCFISTRTSSQSTSSELKDFVAPIQLNIVADPPEIACGDVLLPVCTSQLDIVAAYNDWKNGDNIVIVDPGTLNPDDGTVPGFDFTAPFDDLPADSYCKGFSTSYKFIYEDYCGHKDSVICTFAVDDIEDFTMPADDGETIACASDLYTPTPPAVNDYCGNAITPTGPVVDPTPVCEGDVKYVWTYTDCEGNTHDWTYTFTIEYEDFTMPADDGETIACASDLYTPTPPVVNDNCGDAITPTGPVVDPTPVCEGDVKYVWTYTDCEGNTHDWTYTFTIEYEDFTMPADDGETIACASDLYTPTPPVVNDNCGDAITPTGPVVDPTPVCEGDVKYVWTYTDCEGNTHDWTYTFTIEYEDFTMPADDGETIACASDLYTPTPPVVNDNCGDAITPTGPVVDPTPVCEGDVKYVWTYTDCEGNTHDWTYTFTIEYEDFTMPADDGETIACASDLYTPTPPVVNDNCGDAITPTGPVVDPTPVCEGDVKYVWTYTDCEGNTHDWTYTFTIEYEDFTMPADDGETIACASDLYTPTPPVVNDNCGDAITPTGPVVDPTPVCEGDVKYVWTYTDCEGNTHDWTYTFTIEYEDFTMPADDGETIACASDLYTPTPPVVNDNCGDAITPTGPVVDPTPVCEGDVKYVWTYTDCEGNTHDWTYTFTIEYEDFTMPADDGETIACASDLYTPTPPVVNDNCGDAITPTGPVVDPTPVCEGDVKYVWTYTDCEGNTHDWTYTFTIEYEDFTMPADDGETIACASDLYTPTPPVVNDNCGDAITPTGPVVDPTPVCEGDVKYVWTYTDCEGNTHDWTYTFTIEYEDFTMPADDGETIACASDLYTPTPPVVNDNCGDAITPTGPVVDPTPVCEGDVKYVWTYTDCEGNTHDWTYTFTIEYEDFTMPADDGETIACASDLYTPTPPVVNDNCGDAITPTGPVVDPTPVCEGDVKYVWTYTDCEGNTHDWTYTFTIEYGDFTMPADDGETIACASDLYTPTPPVVNDNCGDAITPTGPVVDPTPVCEGDVKYVWTYTDCEGNSHDWTYTFTIDNNVAPTFDCLDDIVLECNEPLDIDLPTAWDDCDGDIGEVDYVRSDGKALNDPVDEADSPVTVTLTATDCAGNSASCEFKISVLPCDHIFPTQTTCCHYQTGTAYELAAVCYTPTSMDASGSVSNAIPGVFFYYTIVEVTATPFTINVVQSNDGNLNKLFAVHGGKDIKLYTEDCGTVSSVNVWADGVNGSQAHMTVTGVAPGTYVLGVKYNVKSIIGATYAGAAPVSTYSFSTDIGGSYVSGSYGMIDAVPGCTDNTPLPGSCSLSASTSETQTLTTLSLKSATTVTAYPNPFSDNITFEFTANQDGKATIELFNMFGQKVATVLKQLVTEGEFVKVDYAPEGIVSGTYIYRFILGDTVLNGELIYQEQK